ncbi:hypothetical protein MKZ38_001283 [Zalerion maritima]|uniref:Signal peptide peptidase n=1 Tax=Zalerion maritima TaxID=339359 RepID=A0AAD5RRH7_9PEZI|nr:hypothetical protein MKZ38_001283 [Zalerion maritima]
MDEIIARICGNSPLDSSGEEQCSFVQATLEYLAREKASIFLQLRITLTALAVIYAASHGAIQRPHSAAPKRRISAKGNDQNKKHADDDKTHLYAQSLIASDMIMFPVTAGAVLIGLYYVIKWLEDPDIINLIFRWWLGIGGLFTATVCYTHVLGVVKNLLLPCVWRDWRGRTRLVSWKSGKVYQLRRVHHPRKDQDSEGKDGEKGDSDVPTIWEPLPLNTVPAPYPIPKGKARRITSSVVWGVFDCFNDKWSLVFNCPGAWPEPDIVRLTLADMLSVLAALMVSLVQAFAASISASNVSGVAMAYGTMLLMSPTSFPIGSAVLLGLCIYDIVMVFYTPFMVTVAQSIDAPIKLTFQSEGAMSIIGLGDIIIPGIMIAMCLRFDIWRHYKNKITKRPITLDTTYTADNGEAAVQQTEATMDVKAEYADPSGRWGDWLWTRGNPTKEMQATIFKKTYFHAAMVGYSLGMVLTMVVLTIFRQGQPALLYLVPSVVGTIWLTGLVRGELRLLWGYSEDGSLDTEDVVTTMTPEGNNGKAEKIRGEDKEEEERSSSSSTSSSCSSRASENKEWENKHGNDKTSSTETEDDSSTSIATPGSSETETPANTGTSFPEEPRDDSDSGDDLKFDLESDVVFLFSLVRPRRLRRLKRRKNAKKLRDGKTKAEAEAEGRNTEVVK